MSIKEFLTHISARIHNAFTSSRGREAALYITFIGISTVFWLLLTLNNEMQQDIDIPISVMNVPDSVTILSDIPDCVKVSVRDKGSSLLRNKMSRKKPLRVDWREHSTANNLLRISKVDLGGMMRDILSPTAQIITAMPDSLRLEYTTSPGRKVPVRLKSDLSAAIGFVINGDIIMSPDSVTLYSITDIPGHIDEVNTYSVVRSGLSDTTHVGVRIEPIEGVKIVPPQIVISIPVEPLIARSQMVPVVANNVPAESGLLTFPSQVEVSYLVPMSEFSSAFDIKAYVNYHDIHLHDTDKLAVTLSYHPAAWRNINIVPDSVEYIVERKF